MPPVHAAWRLGNTFLSHGTAHGLAGTDTPLWHGVCLMSSAVNPVRERYRNRITLSVALAPLAILASCAGDRSATAQAPIRGSGANALVFEHPDVTPVAGGPLWERWEYARNDRAVSAGVDSRLSGVSWPAYDRAWDIYLPPIRSRWGRSY